MLEKLFIYCNNSDLATITIDKLYRKCRNFHPFLCDLSYLCTGSASGIPDWAILPGFIAAPATTPDSTASLTSATSALSMNSLNWRFSKRNFFWTPGICICSFCHQLFARWNFSGLPSCLTARSLTPAVLLIHLVNLGPLQAASVNPFLDAPYGIFHVILRLKA